MAKREENVTELYRRKIHSPAQILLLVTSCAVLGAAAITDEKSKGITVRHINLRLASHAGSQTVMDKTNTGRGAVSLPSLSSGGTNEIALMKLRGGQESPAVANLKLIYRPHSNCGIGDCGVCSGDIHICVGGCGREACALPPCSCMPSSILICLCCAVCVVRNIIRGFGRKSVDRELSWQLVKVAGETHGGMECKSRGLRGAGTLRYKYVQ